MTAQPKTLLFSLARSVNSWSERGLESCAKSNLKITSWAMWSFSFASDRRFWLQECKTLVFVYSLWPKRWNSSVCVVGAFHCWRIPSLFDDLLEILSFTQKFSNL